MNEQQQALASQLVAHSNWRWTPGMAFYDPPEMDFDEPGDVRVLDVAEDGDVYATAGTYCSYWDMEECIPDIADPATVGCLLDLLGEHRSWIIERNRTVTEYPKLRGHWWTGPRSENPYGSATKNSLDHGSLGEVIGTMLLDAWNAEGIRTPNVRTESYTEPMSREAVDRDDEG